MIWSTPWDRCGPFAATTRTPDHRPDPPPYHDFLERSGLFDGFGATRRRVCGNPAPCWRGVGACAAAFDRVYDLQTSDRSALYFHLMGPGPRPLVRCGGRRQPPPDEARANGRHTVERQRDQLALAGIDEVPLVDLADMAGRRSPPSTCPTASRYWRRARHRAAMTNAGRRRCTPISPTD